MSVAVVNTWTGGYAPPAGFFFPRSATGPVQVAVANGAGNWLVAVIALRPPAVAAKCSVCVSDDARNWWEPVGAPNADSPSPATVRAVIWAAPAARAPSSIQVAPTGPYTSLAVAVYEVSGLGPGWLPKVIAANHAGAATSLTVGGGTVASQSLVLAILGAGEFGGVITPPAGWTPLTGSTILGSGTSSGDITVAAAYQVITGSVPAAAWSSSVSCSLAGTTGAVAVAAPVPSQASPNWPAVITEAAIGSGPQSPPAAMTWTDMSARSLALQVQQGRQYTLSQLQAAQGTITLDDPDGALIPPGTGSFTGIDSGTPVRRRCYWPHGTMASTPWSVPFSGYFRRWPFTVAGDLLRGQVAAEVSDIWAYATGSLDSIAREELLLDGPYALWPLSDPAGSATASSIAPGNPNPLVLTVSKLGAGGAAAAFGATPPGGGLLGDSSARTTGSATSSGASGMFSQASGGTSPDVNGYGYALGCYDSNYPPVAGGVTLEAWAQGAVNQNATGNGFFAVTSGSLFTVTGSSFANGTPVVLATSPPLAFPGGFTAGTVYFVISASGASFQLAGAPGGSAITVTVAGSGFLVTTTAWNPVVVSARNIKGPVAELNVRNSDGALQLLYGTASGTRTTVVLDTSLDYRNTSLWHASLAFNATSYQVLVNGGATAAVTGSFSASLPAFFDELWYAGIMDRQVTGFTFPCYLALAAVYPGMLAQSRVVAHYWGAIAGMKLDPAHERVDRVLGYAGITGRRWIGQQATAYELDIVASGQDVGGSSAGGSAGNIAASTVPGLLYVAPTGDITYLAKQYSWNQAVRWTLGDNTAGGEIPFSLASFGTDYDPARLYNDVQLAQLDTQSVTGPAGATASTTVAAMVAASEAQYGDQPYQQTGYLEADYAAAYNAGSGLTDLAAWIAMIYGRPRNRVPGVIVNAAAYPLAWPLWQLAAVGDMVQVNVRLPTAVTSPLVSVIARITQTQRSMKWSTDSPPVATITLTLDAAPEYNALTCDDATRGLLNGTNVLPW